MNAPTAENTLVVSNVRQMTEEHQVMAETMKAAFMKRFGRRKGLQMYERAQSDPAYRYEVNQLLIEANKAATEAYKKESQS